MNRKILDYSGRTVICIAGLVGEGGVYIGGDGAGVAGWSLSVKTDEKVSINGGFISDFTSSFRMGQILRFGFQPLRLHGDADLYMYVVTSFIDAVRRRFKEAGYITNEKGRETGGTFPIGHGRRLFRVSDDFQLGEASQRYDAIGCGQDVALGSRYATKKLDGCADPQAASENQRPRFRPM